MKDEEITEEEIAMLTMRRIQILKSLRKEGKFMSRISRDLGMDLTTVLKALRVFGKYGIVEKDLNKLWKLTEHGQRLEDLIREGTSSLPKVNLDDPKYQINKNSKGFKMLDKKGE